MGEGCVCVWGPVGIGVRFGGLAVEKCEEGLLFITKEGYGRSIQPQC